MQAYIRWTFIALLGLSFINNTQAKPITQNYLEHNSTSDFANADHLPYANPNAPKGGILSWNRQGTFNSAKKWSTKGVPMSGLNLMYDNLMSSSLDEAFTAYPLLAEKVTFDPDDKSWIIFHVNPKARFSDGSEVTSADVKATFEALLTKGPMLTRSYLSDIKNIEIIDKYQTKFNFKDDKNKELSMLIGQYPVFKKSSIESGFDTVNLKPLIGSGPYTIHKLDPGRSVTYKRNPNYWGKDLMVNRGRFNFDMIKYIYYLSNEIAFEGFKAGQYQFRYENSARKWSTAYNFPAAKQKFVKKEKIKDYTPVVMQALAMNLRRPIFQDVRTRKALTLAYDFEWANKALYYNQFIRILSYFYNSELEAKGKPSQKELKIIKEIKPLIPKDHYQAVLDEWKLPKNDGKGYNRENLLKARKLLLEAGFSYKDMKLYTPDGKRAKINFLDVADGSSRSILPYLKNLKRLGFDANLVAVDNTQYVNRRRKFDFDMMLVSYPQSLSPGNEQISYWGSQTVQEQGNKNYVGVANPAIDEVIKRLIASGSREDIILNTKVLDRLLRAGYYMVPTFNTNTYNFTYWKQYKHAKSPKYAPGIEYWWVDKKAEEEVNSYLKRK